MTLAQSVAHNMNKKEKEFYSEPFNEHTSQNCKGHRNNLTGDTYEEEDDRELLVKILDNYIKDDI